MRWVLLVLAVLVLGFVILTVPDVRRYLRLKRM
jgi:hypothetical protein